MSPTDLEFDAIRRWLNGRLPDLAGPVAISKFDVGQSNPTYRIETEGKTYVLRRQPDGKLMKSAHAVDREFKVLSALRDTPVPVPKPFVLCVDPEIIGPSFYIMEHVAGLNLHDPSLPGLHREQRGRVFGDMIRVLAAIHDVALCDHGLEDFGAPGHYLERQVSRWTRQYRSAATEENQQMDQLIHWLTDTMPADDGQRSLIHGDFRLDNLIFDADGVNCLAVLDWELSTLGHPYSDVAALIMQLRMPQGPEGRGLAGVDRAALGIPSETALLARYCARRGLPALENFDYFLAFSFFRMAAILQGVKYRALQGNASNPQQALRLAGQIPKLIEGGLDAARLE
ncbi:MAG: phosphotransferase family protein [Pseudomonadota bacterium]